MLAWLPLLKQYRSQFANWIPDLDHILGSFLTRSPPYHFVPQWWEVLRNTFGGMEVITRKIVSRFRVTLFGRYRCHSPSI